MQRWTALQETVEETVGGRCLVRDVADTGADRLVTAEHGVDVDGSSAGTPTAAPPRTEVSSYQPDTYAAGACSRLNTSGPAGRWPR